MSVFPHAIQQNSFADAPKTDHQDAFGRLPKSHSLKCDTDSFAELFTPGGAFRAIAGDFGDDLSFAASTVLADGGALIAGGYDDTQRNSARIWRYLP